MLSSASEYMHSRVIFCPSRTGSVGPLMSKVAACGQRSQTQVIDHIINTPEPQVWSLRWPPLGNFCLGQCLKNNHSLFLSFVSSSCWKHANMLKWSHYQQQLFFWHSGGNIEYVPLTAQEILITLNFMLTLHTICTVCKINICLFLDNPLMIPSTFPGLVWAS